MPFPSRDLTSQYISLSYQDVVQRYNPGGTSSYYLDGLGNELFTIPTAYAGQQVLTVGQSASYSVISATAISSSYALSSEFSDSSSLAVLAEFSDTSSLSVLSVTSSYSITSSYALNAGSPITTGSTYPITASWSNMAVTSSYVLGNVNNAEQAISASWASSSISASYLEGQASIIRGLQFDTASAVEILQEGYVYWDNNAHTLAIKPDNLSSTLQVGQELWVRVRAQENIPNGTPVYVVSGTSSISEPYVAIAVADGLDVKYDVLGISTDFISSGSIGLVTVHGEVHDLDLSMFNAGDKLYLHTASGQFTSTPPPFPYEKVPIGHVINNTSGSSKLLVNVTPLESPNHTFVGSTTVPTISTGSVTSSGSIIIVGESRVNLCTTSDGTGNVQNYLIPSASLVVTSSYLDTQYVVANYNSGSPRYELYPTRTGVDNIQTCVIYSVLMGSQGKVSYSDWDTPGLMLANKDYLRVINLRNIEREYGYDLGVSGSTAENYLTISSGRAWKGVKIYDLSSVNSGTDRFVLISHSASVWSGSIISASVYDRYDNGTNLTSLPNGDFVINWIYRGVGNLNTSLVQLSDRYGTFSKAVEGQPPAPPDELKDSAFLVGRIIIQNTTNPLNRFRQLDSAFVQTFTPAGITIHNNLSGLQGGTSDEYYHLTATEYGNSSSGSFLRQTGSNFFGTSSWSRFATTSSYASSASFSLSASYSPVEPAYSASVALIKQNSLIVGNTYPITASWSNNSVTSSYSVTAENATSSSFSSFANSALTASYALTSSFELEIEISSSWASASLSASYVSASTSIVAELTSSNLEVTDIFFRGNHAITYNTFGGISFGITASADGINNLALGNNATADGNEDKIAIGTNAIVGMDGAIALGAQSSVTGSFSVGIGHGVSVNADNVIILGTTQNVGIGDSNPINRLDVVGNISCSIITASLHGNADTATSSSWSSASISSSYSLTSSYIQSDGTSSLLTTTSSNVVVFQKNTSSYNSAFFDYVLISGSICRVGTIFGAWTGTTITYSEFSTNTFGNLNITTSLVLSESYVQYIINVPTENWMIKTNGRYL